MIPSPEAFFSWGEEADLAHVKMLLQACYFSLQDYLQMKPDLQALEESDENSSSRAKELRVNLYIAKSFIGALSIIVNEGFEKAKELSCEEVLEIVKKTYVKSGHLTAKAYKKSSGKSHRNILELSGKLSKEGKKFFVLKALDTYKKVKTDEISDLCSVVRSECFKLASKAVKKWRDPSAAGFSKISKLFSYGNKDIWINSILSYFPKLRGDEAYTISASTYLKGLAVAKSLASKISDFSVADAVKVNSLFSYGDKDIWLEESGKNIKAISKVDLITFVKPSYLKGLDLAKKHYKKVTGKTIQNAVSVSYLTDLKQSNIELLARAWYLENKEIQKKAKKKLEDAQ